MKLKTNPQMNNMNHKELSELSDEELLEEAKKMKSTHTMNAVLIGVMIGVIIFSIWKNTVGLFTLIPLFFAFKIFNKPNNNKALEQLLRERNLQD